VGVCGVCGCVYGVCGSVICVGVCVCDVFECVGGWIVCACGNLGVYTCVCVCTYVM